MALHKAISYSTQKNFDRISRFSTLNSVMAIHSTRTLHITVKFRQTSNLLPCMNIHINSDSSREIVSSAYPTMVVYTHSETPFGDVLISATDQGICSLFFTDTPEQSFMSLTTLFPKARIQPRSNSWTDLAAKSLTNWPEQSDGVKLHVYGTSFQLSVWRSLLRIPYGKTVSYSEVASMTGRPMAARATGSAVAKNPVSLLIPCHRVIRSNGEVGQYHWGVDRKCSILHWETAKKAAANRKHDHSERPGRRMPSIQSHS